MESKVRTDILNWLCEGNRNVYTKWQSAGIDIYFGK